MSPAHSFIQLVSPSALGAFSFRPARIYCRERFPENQVCVFQSTQYTGEHFRFRTTLCSASAFRIERETFKVPLSDSATLRTQLSLFPLCSSIQKYPINSFFGCYFCQPLMPSFSIYKIRGFSIFLGIRSENCCEGRPITFGQSPRCDGNAGICFV